MASVQDKTVAYVDLGDAVAWSADAGQTWSMLKWMGGIPQLVIPAGRGSILLGRRAAAGEGGIYALGAGVPASAAGVPCATPIASTFTTAFSRDPKLSTVLGCAVAPEHATQFRIWRDKPVQGAV